MAKRRIGYGLLLLGVFLFYIFYVNYFSFYTLVLFLALPLVSFILSLFARKGIHVELESTQPAADKGGAVPLRVSVSNNSVFTAGKVKIVLAIENELYRQTAGETLILPAGRTAQILEYTVRSDKYGRLTFRVDRLYSYDYLGLFAFREKTNGSVPCSVLIAPEPQPFTIEKEALTGKNPDSDTFSKTKPGDDPSEVFGVRPYQPGDKPNRISWKLLAKLDAAMVKEYSLPLMNRVLVFLDCSGDSAQWDVLLETTLSLCGSLLEQDIPLTLHRYTGPGNSGDRVTIDTPEQLPQIFSILLSFAPDYSAVNTSQTGVDIPLSAYSGVLHLCAGVTADSLNKLDELFPNLPVQTFLVTDDDAQIAGARSLLGSGAAVTVIDPTQPY